MLCVSATQRENKTDVRDRLRDVYGKAKEHGTQVIVGGGSGKGNDWAADFVMSSSHELFDFLKSQNDKPCEDSVR